MKKGKKIFIATVAVIAAVAAAEAIVYNHRSSPANAQRYAGDNQYITPTGKCLVSAHRSGGDLQPEETMAAFRNCVESKDFETDVFEFDLHITSDNVLVLLHDDTLDRTSDCCEVFGKKKVLASSKTYEQLRTLNMGANFEAPNGSKPYAGLKGSDVPDDLRIVRVDDVLDYLSSSGDFDYIIEIKNGGDEGRRGVDVLYNVLSERNLLDKVIFGTFHGEISKYVDDNYPDLMRSAGIKEVLNFYFSSLIGRKNLNPKYSALQIPYRLAGFNLGTTKIINYAHRYDLAVQYWTINEADEIDYLNSIGADCIMSDDPYLAYTVINSD